MKKLLILVSLVCSTFSMAECEVRFRFDTLDEKIDREESVSRLVRAFVDPSSYEFINSYVASKWSVITVNNHNSKKSDERIIELGSLFDNSITSIIHIPVDSKWSGIFKDNERVTKVVQLTIGQMKETEAAEKFGTSAITHTANSIYEYTDLETNEVISSGATVVSFSRECSTVK